MGFFILLLLITAIFEQQQVRALSKNGFNLRQYFGRASGKIGEYNIIPAITNYITSIHGDPAPVRRRLRMERSEIQPAPAFKKHKSFPRISRVVRKERGDHNIHQSISIEITANRAVCPVYGIEPLF